MCLSAKPAVDGLEREYEGRALVLRADIRSDAGRTLAAHYGIRTVPGWVVFDGRGEVVWRAHGTRGAPIPDLRRALRDAGAG